MNSSQLLSYVVYVVIALTAVTWLTRTLASNGGVFLEEVFRDRPGVAEAVNKLLVVGFAMLNIGYALFVFEPSGADATAATVFESTLTQIGRLLLILGVLHFINVFVFWKIRRGQEDRMAPPPVPPQMTLPKPVA